MAKRKRLISGEKLNCRYPRCVEIWAHPPVTLYVVTLKTNLSGYEISATA